MKEIKKNYERPQVEVTEVKPQSIICASAPQFTTEQLQEEEYEW